MFTAIAEDFYDLWEKVSCFVALAPITYLGGSHNQIFEMLEKAIPTLKKFLDDLDENQGLIETAALTAGKLVGTAVAATGFIPLAYGMGSALFNWDANKIFVQCLKIYVTFLISWNSILKIH